jgi:HEAT repeat protein
LGEIYLSPSADPRTRDFIIVALGALNSPHALPIIQKALNDSDKNVGFHAITALGNMSKENLVLDWKPLFKLLRSTDFGIQQAMILTLGTHRVVDAEPLIEGLLNSEDLGVRYAAARVLINFKNNKAIPLLKNILMLKPSLEKKDSKLDARQVEILKLNILMSLKKEKWTVLNEALKKLSEVEDETKVALKAMEVLKVLKN